MSEGNVMTVGHLHEPADADDVVRNVWFPAGPAAVEVQCKDRVGEQIADESTDAKGGFWGSLTHRPSTIEKSTVKEQCGPGVKRAFSGKHGSG